MRYRGGHSSVGLELGKLFLAEYLKSSYKSRWRVGNDIHQCILCGRCENMCGVNALTVNKHAKTWTLNNYRCVKCLKCVNACPVSSLSQVRV